MGSQDNKSWCTRHVASSCSMCEPHRQHGAWQVRSG